MRPLVLTIAVLLTAGEARAQDAPPLLTLGAAVELARRHHPGIQEAISRIDESRLALQAAQSAFRPQFVPRMSGALGGGDLANQSYGADFAQQFPWGTQLQARVGSSSARNQLGTFYYSDTTLSLTHAVYRGGAADPARRARDEARRAIEAATADHQRREQLVAIDVAAAYYAVAAQQQVIAVAANAVERHRRVLAVSEAKLEIGKVSQLDVLRAQQLVREAENRLADAHASAEDARDDLRLLIGRRDAALFVVSTSIPEATGHDTIDGTQAITRDRHPDVVLARAALARAEVEARAARRPVLPRVDASLALTRREIGSGLRASFGLDRFRLVPMLQMSLPIDHPGLQGGAQRAAIEVVRRQRDLAAAELNADVEARRVVRHASRMLTQLRDAEASVTFARQQVDVARARFERGLSNNLDLVDAEADLLAAESRRISAAAALAVARLQVRAAAGTLDLGKDFQ